jgi:hypothetical protein
MKTETEAITDDEWLFRRVRIEKFRTDKVPVISPNAFEPRISGRDPDTEGISLYRAACLESPSDVLATIAPDRWHENGIVQVSVSYLKALGLSVQIAPDAQIKGHVVIPELNAIAYATNKAGFTPVKLSLAMEASKDENIVMWPGGMAGERQIPS